MKATTPHCQLILQKQPYYNQQCKQNYFSWVAIIPMTRNRNAAMKVTETEFKLLNKLIKTIVKDTTS